MIVYFNKPVNHPGQGIETMNNESETREKPGYMLSSECISSPHGFMVTAFAFEEFLTHNSLHYPLHNLMQLLNSENYANLSDIAGKARSLLRHAEIPNRLRSSIAMAYKDLGINEPVLVSMQTTSAANENKQSVFGEHKVIEAVKKCFTGLYAEDAIRYRQENGLVHDKAAMAVTVQKMHRLPQHVRLADPQLLN